ncbi:YdcF family protein [Metabacillus sediminilitoris]|uniref:YdcF family protein n=1 Tax=Metabacillus sediminilitoris TaxID=2567941 RepID=A0A4S4C1A3_9BACI|nr:YdcF family protein [Metabacillus sediminilitoris]QGQ48229.1 YdcF family protein [Metabacillus sediminilitoris]THF81412.1 YdcF family protein [Metabacillus sediminilitoris]
MVYIIKFIYSFFTPPGIFPTALFILSYFTFKRNKLLFKWILSIAIVNYLYVIPITGQLLLLPLEQKYSVPKNLDGDVLVMLGGGATHDTHDLNGKGHLSGAASSRLISTVQLYNETKLPIIVSGGQVFQDSGNEAEIAKRLLVSLGVNPNDIYMEDRSLNTEQNAKFTAELLEKHQFEKPILITSAFHMQRAVQHFENEGVAVEAYPTGYLVSKKIDLYPLQFAPSNQSNGAIAVKEYIGLIEASFLRK